MLKADTLQQRHNDEPVHQGVTHIASDAASAMKVGSMEAFLTNNRDELIFRWKAKAAKRTRPVLSTNHLEDGVPRFLEQLRKAFAAESKGHHAESSCICGHSGGEVLALSEMGISAAAHGKKLLELGFTVDEVVHDYGNLCQAIADLAVERHAPIRIDQFRTLNRCLDNVIAEAVAGYSLQRDADLVGAHSTETNKRVGCMVHELRNGVGTAKLAFEVLQKGDAVLGPTGAVLERSLNALSTLIDTELDHVRTAAMVATQGEIFSLFEFVEDARQAAELDANARGCELTVTAISKSIGISGNRQRLLGAVANLLQNAFKFTHRGTKVTLKAYAVEERVFIDVEDHCGGLAPGHAENMFSPFRQGSRDRTGLGLGLTIARESVEADAGNMSVRNVEGSGCVFTISLPRCPLH